MEYPKNNAYCPVSAFKYRGSGAVPFAAETLKSQEHKNTCLDGMSLAMVYSPCQYFEKLYEPMDGLHCGTIFCKLYMPFAGNRR